VALEPLIQWTDPARELAGFLSKIVTAGAVGFYFSALAPLRRSADAAERAMATGAAARAASFGIAGMLIGLAFAPMQLSSMAARMHISVPAIFSSFNLMSTLIAFELLALVAFIMARSGSAAAWPAATMGVVGGSLRAALFMQWQRLINPTHELAAGLWVGSLSVMLAAGFPAALRGSLPADRRGPAIATMVNAFSPLALASAAVLATFGVITGWLHLGRLSALWTTPYGWALIAKLCVVAGVLGLGAWNWRRQKPRLGSESGGMAIERSARIEMMLAGVVVLITAILVSLPAPAER
jgi:putative copper resistance protein D